MQQRQHGRQVLRLIVFEIEIEGDDRPISAVAFPKRLFYVGRTRSKKYSSMVGSLP